MTTAPKTLFDRLKYIGPSVIVTGSVVGSGSIVMTPLLGAAAGFVLLWWLLLSMWSKPIIQAEISRYIVVTRKTFLEAFSDMPGFKTTINGKTTSWLVWLAIWYQSIWVQETPPCCQISAKPRGGFLGPPSRSRSIILEIMINNSPNFGPPQARKFWKTTLLVRDSQWGNGVCKGPKKRRGWCWPAATNRFQCHY